MTYQPPPHGFRTFVVVWGTQSVSVFGSGLTFFALTIWLTQVLYPRPEQKPELAWALAAIELAPNRALVKDMVVCDQYGYIVTRHDLVHPVERMMGIEEGETNRRMPYLMETSTPGIFAAGDVRAGSTKQVASAVGEGASAAIAIRGFLKRG